MSDMTQVIVPKSDQMNADDLISGPVTIKITGVTIKSGEQPISIHYEGDNGKPYKACKSMCRVMVTAWGADSKRYTGRSMTLYRDPSVKWAGMEVGGIRISHMTDIDSALTMALTATKGSRKPYRVDVLVDHDAAIKAATTLTELTTAWTAIPKTLKPTHEAAKDARKAELMKAGATAALKEKDAATATDPHADFKSELDAEASQPKI